MSSVSGANFDLGWERVDSSSFTVNPGYTVTESVQVSTGKKATGGGFNIDGLSLVVMFSRPSSDGSGWDVCVHNSGSSASTFSIFVVGANV